MEGQGEKQRSKRLKKQQRVPEIILGMAFKGVDNVENKFDDAKKKV